jgi:hypothetical protein
MLKKFFVLGLVFFYVAEAFSLEYGLTGGVRSTPQSLSAGVYGKNGLVLWDKRNAENIWQYGFVNVGGEVAIHGLAEAQIEFRPVSILGITVFKSYTTRFYKTKTLDCELIDCGGNLVKSGYRLQLLLGFGDYLLVPGLSNTRFDSESTGPIAGESEFIIFSSPTDVGISKNLFLGKKIDGAVLGIYHNEIVNDTFDEIAKFDYVIYKFPPKDNLTYAVGAGFFESSHAARIGSVFVNAGMSFGEKLGL